jgi:hypothetical protein
MPEFNEEAIFTTNPHKEVLDSAKFILDNGDAKIHYPKDSSRERRVRRLFKWMAVLLLGLAVVFAVAVGSAFMVVGVLNLRNPYTVIASYVSGPAFQSSVQAAMLSMDNPGTAVADSTSGTTDIVGSVGNNGTTSVTEPPDTAGPQGGTDITEQAGGNGTTGDTGTPEATGTTAPPDVTNTTNTTNAGGTTGTSGANGTTSAVGGTGSKAVNGTAGVVGTTVTNGTDATTTADTSTGAAGNSTSQTPAPSIILTSSTVMDYQNVGAGTGGANGGYTSYVIDSGVYLRWYAGTYAGQIMYIVNTNAVVVTSYFYVPVWYEGTLYTASSDAVYVIGGNTFYTCVWDGATWRVS